MNYIRDKVTDPRDDWSLEPALSNQCWWVVGGLQVGVTIKNPLLFSNSQCCTLYSLLSTSRYYCVAETRQFVVFIIIQDERKERNNVKRLSILSLQAQ